jgi:hypothetical protein
MGIKKVIQNFVNIQTTQKSDEKFEKTDDFRLAEGISKEDLEN